MSPRIIAGSAKGQRVEAPPGLDVRPTTDRVREALFSILQTRIAGAAFLDLFAGTGLNGFEALSRGAARAVFIDNHPQVQTRIAADAARLGFGTRVTIRRGELPEMLAGIAALGPFDIVYVDPPYRAGLYESVLEALSGKGVVADDGLVICEHDAKKETLPSATGRFRETRMARYGSTALTFFC